MRWLLCVIATAAALVAMVTGCSGAPGYDGRLVAADSLMHDRPDSALALVEAVSADSLPVEADRAYRDLLLTQARYRCYVTATSDSAISRALSYYRCHDSEREKLTRCYIYKGAVMEELGHPDSAMYYYKHAETTAAPDDYFNLGQINSRIAGLYRQFYADMQVCYDKYRNALKYYQLTNDKLLQLHCLLYMGGCSGITRTNDPEELLEQASLLALDLNDSSSYFVSQELLCRQLYYNNKSRGKAKQIALHCFNNYSKYVNSNLLLDLADIYAHDGMADSSHFYLNLLDKSPTLSNLTQIKTRKYYILSRVSRLEGDLELSNYYEMLAHQKSDSIINDKQKFLIQQIETSFNTRNYTSIASHVNKLQISIFCILLVAIMVIMLLVVVYIKKLRKTKAVIRELEKAQVNYHEDLRSQLDDKSQSIDRLLSNLIDLIKTTVSESRAINDTSDVAKRLKETIVDIANDDFWAEMRNYVDKNHDGLITKIEQSTNLKEKDIKFIELTCCGFSYVEIAMIMDYSPRYVFNKRKIIAKKLDLPSSLQDYLNSLMANKE